MVRFNSMWKLARSRDTCQADMDTQKIVALVDQYGALSPEAIAALDEDRHTLSGEEAAALDRVMQDPARARQIQKAIAQLDLMKRYSFRLFIAEFVVYAFLTGSIELFTGANSHKANGLLWLAILLYASLLRPRLVRLLVLEAAPTESASKL